MFQLMEPPPEGGGTEGQAGQGLNGLPNTQPDNLNNMWVVELRWQQTWSFHFAQLICELCAGARPPEGGMSESQSWVTAKAQEMFQKTGNWSPDRPYTDDLHDNCHNSQVGTHAHAQPCFRPHRRLRCQSDAGESTLFSIGAAVAMKMLIITFPDAKTEHCSSELQVMPWIWILWHLPFKFTFMRSESLASLDAPVCLWPHLAQRSRVAVLWGCSMLARAGGHVVWRPPSHCSFPHLCQCHLSSASSLLSWILVHHPPNTNNSKQEPWTHTSPLHVCHIDTSHHASFAFHVALLCLWHRGLWLVSAWPSPAITHESPPWEGPGPISGLKYPCYIHYRDVRVGQTCFLVCFQHHNLVSCQSSCSVWRLCPFLLHNKLKAGKAS